MQIRPLTQDDFFLLNQMDWSPLPRERDSIYLTIAVGQNACSFIAWENHEFLGVILATRSCEGTSIYVNHLLVSELARGQGVGRKLLQRLEQYALDSEVSHIWLLCQDETVNWYEALGYRETSEFLTPGIEVYLRDTKKVHVFLKEFKH